MTTLTRRDRQTLLLALGAAIQSAYNSLQTLAAEFQPSETILRTIAERQRLLADFERLRVRLVQDDSSSAAVD